MDGTPKAHCAMNIRGLELYGQPRPAYCLKSHNLAANQGQPVDVRFSMIDPLKEAWLLWYFYCLCLVKWRMNLAQGFCQKAQARNHKQRYTKPRYSWGKDSAEVQRYREWRGPPRDWVGARWVIGDIRVSRSCACASAAAT